MVEILVPILFLILGSIILLKRRKKVGEVPTASGCLPIIGHALAFMNNPKGFLDACRKKYGNFFRMKLFHNSFVMVCDRSAMNYYTKQDDSTFSFHGLLEDIYFGVGFSDTKLPIGLENLRKGVTIKVRDATPSMQIEAQRLVKATKASNLNSALDYDAQWELIGRYVASTSTRSFLNVELQEDTFQCFREFQCTLQRAMLWGTVIPINWVHFFFFSKLSQLRKKIRESMIDLIEEYRGDPSLKESFMLRTAVDAVDKNTWERNDSHQAAAILLAAMFASTINSSACILNVLIDLAKTPDICDELRCQMTEFIQNDDMDGVLHSELLTACVMETSRLHSTSIGLVRKIKSEVNLGGFHLKKGELIAIANHMMMEDETLFKEPLKYNPRRFLGENPESWSQYSVLTWSAGTHLCPGKQFAINEIKIGLAYLLSNFKINVPPGEILEDVKTLHVFSDRKVPMTFTPV